MGPYIRSQSSPKPENSKEEDITRLWPLIKNVEVTVPDSQMIPEGVIFVDIPGTGDFNAKRDEMWKEVTGQLWRGAGGKRRCPLLTGDGESWEPPWGCGEQGNLSAEGPEQLFSVAPLSYCIFQLRSGAVPCLEMAPEAKSISLLVACYKKRPCWC